MTAMMTFTVRLPEKLHKLINALAVIENRSAAELSREILHDGLRRLLDPVEIDRQFAAERARIMAAVENLDSPGGQVS